MPALANARHEAFARARARGAGVGDAYEDAGFAPDRSHPYRLAKDEKVAERVAELRAEAQGRYDAEPQALIASLLRIAKAAEADAGPANLKEIRQILVEVDRLRELANHRRGADRDRITVPTFP